MAKDRTVNDFGLLIAYLVPGAVALAGLSRFSGTLRGWFATAPVEAPTLGGFLYLTAAALAAGMTLNAVRWALIDTLHAKTGLPPPPLDFSRLGGSVEGYILLIEIHYQHYQFYANMLVATALAYACYRLDVGLRTPGWLDAGVGLLALVFYVTSRDTLRKYYSRTEQLLSPRTRRGRRSRTSVTRLPRAAAPTPGRIP